MPVFLEDILQGIRRTEKINHFDHTSHIVRLQCGDKYAYLPRYVDISEFADLTKTVTDFLLIFMKNALNYGNMQRTQSIKKTLPY